MVPLVLAVGPTDLPLVVLMVHDKSCERS